MSIMNISIRLHNLGTNESELDIEMYLEIELTKKTIELLIS